MKYLGQERNDILWSAVAAKENWGWQTERNVELIAQTYRHMNTHSSGQHVTVPSSAIAGGD